MDYTASVRKYCNDHAGEILDVAYVHEQSFAVVVYRTFLKILKRLEEDGVITRIAKGVYLISRNDGRENDVDAAICDFYVGKIDGMIVGYKLYNELGVSDYDDGHIEIYTNRLPSGKNKNIGKYHLTGANLFFTSEVKRVITLLELIENSNRIVNRSLLSYAGARQKLAGSCSEELLQEITKTIPYQTGTLAVLRRTGGNVDIV